MSNYLTHKVTGFGGGSRKCGLMYGKGRNFFSFSLPPDCIRGLPSFYPKGTGGFDVWPLSST